MRVRNINGIEEKIETFGGERFIKDGTVYKGQWYEYFGNNNPIYIEIGCGKGQFIDAMSCYYKNINFIAIERVEEILYKAVIKLKNQKNLCFLLMDGSLLSDIFAENEVQRIYLNFSDPWPKKRHAKRRLISPLFLKEYCNVLDNGSAIHFKTDNKDLFNYSIYIFKEENWQLNNVDYDYHKKEGAMDFSTEYENKFRIKGQPIFRLEAIRPQTKNTEN